MNKQEKLFRAYAKILMHVRGMKPLEVEDVNEIVLSKEFYIGEYDLEAWLNHYKHEFEAIRTYLRQFEKDLINKPGLMDTKKRIKI